MNSNPSDKKLGWTKNTTDSVRSIPFTRYSVNVSKDNKKTIWIDGEMNDKREFYEITKIDSVGKKIEFETVSKLYGKSNSRMNAASYAHSFITQNDKYMIFISNVQVGGYSVYDLELDKWLDMPLTESNPIELSSYGYRSLLINDEIIIISEMKSLSFYSIKDDIKKPIAIATYDFGNSDDSNNSDSIENDKVKARRFHGFACVGYKYTNENDNENYVHSIETLIFGGEYHNSFLQSFVKVDITIEYSKQNKYQINVKKNNVLFSNIDNNGNGYDLSQLNAKRLCDFGYECIVNSRNETIVIILGGDRGIGDIQFSKSVMLYNVATNELIVKQDFLDFKCRDYPATTMIKNTCVVLQNQDCMCFKIFNDYLPWSIARLIWIGFEKNEKNDSCLIDQLPKDIVKYILLFVGRIIIDDQILQTDKVLKL